MSYTFVVNEDFRKKQTENRINAAVRRCKIGKVTPKTGITWVDHGFIPRPTPGSTGFVPWHLRGPQTGDPARYLDKTVYL